METCALSDQSRPSKRRDATRNRSRLIAAAREVFAELGPDAPLEEVAERASVTRTTLYRHFSSRQELAREIYARDVAKIEGLSAKVRSDDCGIVELFDFVFDMMMDDRSLFHVVLNPEVEWYPELVDRMSAAFRGAVRSGKAAGIVSDGVTLEDFRLAFAMAQAGAHTLSAERRSQNRNRIRRMLRRALFTQDR
jgi:AcrR family transcriptional regulator